MRRRTHAYVRTLDAVRAVRGRQAYFGARCAERAARAAVAPALVGAAAGFTELACAAALKSNEGEGDAEQERAVGELHAKQLR